MCSVLQQYSSLCSSRYWENLCVVLVLQQYSPLCSSGTKGEGLCWSSTTTIFCSGLSSGPVLSCDPVLVMKFW
jgi:hypothetical protein